MPPKRTPSKETATADPQLGQVLEMLQTMSAQIKVKRADSRVEAAERSAPRDCETRYRYECVSVCLTYVHAA